MPSRQLDQYLQLRADGLDMEAAAFEAGIGSGEAKLHEAAIERGELELPRGEKTMAKRAKPGERVTNLTETKDIIRNAVPRIVNLKNQRKQLNEEIAAEREKVNAAGVPKRALDHAIKIKEMDPEDRQAFDEGYAIARDAIGLPQSRSLFDFIGSGDEAEDEEVGTGNGALAAAKDRLGTDATDALAH